MRPVFLRARSGPQRGMGHVGERGGEKKQDQQHGHRRNNPRLWLSARFLPETSYKLIP